MKELIAAILTHAYYQQQDIDYDQLVMTYNGFVKDIGTLSDVEINGSISIHNDDGENVFNYGSTVRDISP